MCCFSRPVHSVTGTKIFARALAKGRQLLAYSMQLHADEAVAMILPLPVPAKSKTDAVTFINLEKYPTFFDDIAKGFPVPRGRNWGPAEGKSKGPRGELKVVDVGSFEASFVPTVKDFERLDERFRLPTEVWKGLPQYRDYGFAVFKLKPGKKKIHPMAFNFPHRTPGKLFFPTVHIHDGTVHKRAGFDHSLYCQQNSNGTLDLLNWRESPDVAQTFMSMKNAQGLVSAKEHVYLKVMRGKLKNEDTQVELRR